MAQTKSRFRRYTSTGRYSEIIPAIHILCSFGITQQWTSCAIIVFRLSYACTIFFNQAFHKYQQASILEVVFPK